jgi:hypothetical protein
MVKPIPTTAVFSTGSGGHVQEHRRRPGGNI